MITSILGQVTGQLDKRFLLNAFFPTLAFLLACAAVVTTGTGGVAAAIASWSSASTVVQALIVIASVAATLVGANLVANGTLWIIRLFEGWAPPVSWLGRWGASHQLRRARSASLDELHARFPVHKPPEQLTWRDMAPTRLGNVLRSAETYPLGRYGADAVRVWPRLYGLLPTDLRAALDESRMSMEFLLVVAFLASVFTVPATVYLIAAAASLPWTLAALGAGSLVASAAYAAALAPAAVYGDQIRTAFDLYRRSLLIALGVPPPASIHEERQAWDEVIRFLAHDEQARWQYVYP